MRVRFGLALVCLLVAVSLHADGAREASERQRVSHANGAGPGAPASERVGEPEGQSPSDTKDKQDIQALAAAVLAVPAQERAKLLEQRGVTPTHALVDAMVVMGSRRISSADFVAAGEIFEYTQVLARSIGDDVGLADSLLGLGQVYARRGDHERAGAALTESLAIATRLGDQRLTAASLNNLGIVYRLQGDYEAAKEMYRRVLAIAEAAHNEDQVARASNNLGVIETYQGIYDAAVPDLQRGLDIATRLQNAPLVLNGTLNLGNVYYYQGNCVLALDLYGRVLADAERSGAPLSVISALTNIAACERTLGRYDASLEHLRRMMTLADQHKLPAEVARGHYGIAVVYRRERRWPDALAELKRSLEIRESIGDRLGIAETLVERGDVQLNRREYDAALESVTRAASIAEELDLPDVAFGAKTIQGKTLLALGRFADAETALRSAIRGVEATRLRVAGTEIDRARYLSEAVEPYVVLARLLVERHRDFDALVIAEQAHARALAEVVAGHRADDVLTPSERDRQASLRKRLGALNRDIDALQPGTATATRRSELVAARRAARLEEDRFTSSLYAAHPELRLRFGAPTPLALGTLARRLDASTAIVEYVEGPDATLMLVATRGAKGPVVRAHTIAIRSADLDARITAFNTAIAQRDLGVGAEAKALGALLLEPALTTGHARLVVVPDGMLWMLPFHALRGAGDRYVAEDHVVSYAPSIIALQLLAERRTPPGVRAGFLGIADPDPAHPLPDARRQVEALAADPALQGRVLTGSAATEAAVREAIASARVVHIASHGVYEDASPLYSHVVLAPGDGSDTSNDGRLDAWELMQLRLRASLVVLAACETGRGDISSGEGVIGLSWAALAAGSPAAVVSLWRVDETATGEWMRAFYRSWNTAGASRAASDASRALMASGRFRHPFYWAPFVVIGDPSRSSAPASPQPQASAARRSTGSRQRP